MDQEEEDGAPRFWLTAPSLTAMAAVCELMDRMPPDFEIRPGRLPSAELIEFAAQNTIDPRTGLKKPFPERLLVPPPQLLIRDETFAQEFVAQGGPFCSAWLRELFDLDPSTVQYLPVDCSACPPAVRSKDYMFIHVLAYRSVIDLEKSKPWRVNLDESGRPGPERIIAVEEIVFKDRCESDVPLFRDPHDQRWFATDAFAEKVLRAGIEDIAFIDVTAGQQSGEPRIKTL